MTAPANPPSAVTPHGPTSTGPELLARLNNLPFSRWHIRPRLIMGSATFFDAFDALSLAFVLPTLKTAWQLTPGQVGALISIGYVGQFVGALGFGVVAERFGRVRAATLAIALMSVMAIACASAGDYSTLLVFRFIQGIGVGGEVPVAATYINELSPTKSRGRFFLLYELIFPIGLMATGQIGAWLVPSLGWKAMFLAGGLPGIVIAAFVAFLPESPRWLIGRGRLADAEKIVGAIEASTPERLGHPAQSGEVRPSAFTPSAKPGWRELFSPNYRQRTLVVWSLWFCTYFVANGLNNWLPTLYRTVYNLDLTTALRTASLTNALQVVTTLCCALLVDRIGRRRWATMCFVVAGLAFAAIGVIGVESVFTVAIFATFAYGLLGSTTVLLYLYTPEIYPTRARAVGTGMATAWLRIGSSAGPLVIAEFVTAGWLRSVFWMFCGLCVLAAVVAQHMIETSGRKLEEIAP